MPEIVSSITLFDLQGSWVQRFMGSKVQGSKVQRLQAFDIAHDIDQVPEYPALPMG